MARPLKFSPEIQKRFNDAVRVGATYKLACDYAGISESTLARWRDRYGDFDASIKEAEGAAAVGWLAKIEKAANEGQWTAAAWKLERRYPEAYGRQIHEVSGRDGGAIQTEDVSLSDDDRATRILAIVQRARERAAGPADAAESDLATSAGPTD